MTTNQNTNQDPDIVTSIRVPRPLWVRFQIAAEAEHRSAAGELRRLIEERADEYEDQAA